MRGTYIPLKRKLGWEDFACGRDIVLADYISLALPMCGQNSLIPSLVLSKPNPLRWASVWSRLRAGGGISPRGATYFAHAGKVGKTPPKGRGISFSPFP